MALIAGIDFSSLAIDVVLLDEDDDTATHYRRSLEPGKLLDRVRRVRAVMPSRPAWRDSGVIAFAIEEPFFAASPAGLKPLLLTLGAIIATLPPGMPLALLRADDWRRELGLPLRGGRVLHKENSVAFAREHWLDAPTLDDNIADAFCVAWACRELHRAREDRAAA